MRSDPFFAWLVPLAFVGSLAWISIAIALALKGNDMERSDRVAQLYGYSVCLIAVVVALISISSLIDNLFKLSNPLAERGYPYSVGNASLHSFEAYKATADQSNDGTATYQTSHVAGVPFPPKLLGSAPARASVSDAALRARYEALRADRLDNVRYEATRSMTAAIVMLLIAAGLFVFHWRWLRTRSVA
ncbi:MAG: hypothetical protein ABR584_11955 [Candidatus Baltobacteraceae bacterium]